MPKVLRTARLPIATFLLLSASSMAWSQSPPVSASPAAPATAQPPISDDSLDDFAELNRNLATLAEKVSKAQTLVNAGQSGLDDQRAEFQKSVAALLTAFADGGQVSLIGKSALDFVHQRVTDAQQLTTLQPAQKDALIIRWGRTATQIEAAVATLDTTRKDLLEKLQLMQAKADFVDQMAELRQARSIVDAIGDLADRRQSISDRIRDLMTGKPSPPDM
jgi:hypothetical protein